MQINGKKVGFGVARRNYSENSNRFELWTSLLSLLVSDRRKGPTSDREEEPACNIYQRCRCHNIRDEWLGKSM